MSFTVAPRRRRRRWPLLSALAVTGVTIGVLAGLVGTADPPSQAEMHGPAAPTSEAVDSAPSRGAAEDGAHPRAVTPAAPDPTPTREQGDPAASRAPTELVGDIEELLATEELGGLGEDGGLSVLVTDESGATVAELDATSTGTPASTAKLVTAAAALRLLGDDYRYVTRLVATGPIEDGVLDGDLVIAGSGDPALASPVFIDTVYPQRPHTPVASLVRAVDDAGIVEITGAVRGDAGVWAVEPTARGWPDRYLASLDATRSSGLTIDGGRSIRERNGSLLGEAAVDPALLAATVLDALLEEREVEIAEQPARGAAPLGADEVGRVQSPRLADLLAHTVATSDNHMADAIFRTLGVVDGDGTWEASAAAIERTLSDLDVDWRGARLHDGSGLSRENRLSARTLVELDVAMTRREGQRWRDLMAVAGEHGTLRRRLRGTEAEGKVSGKTGALRDARALVARVEGDPAYHFAVLGSELEPESILTVRELMDALAERLAEG